MSKAAVDEANAFVNFLSCFLRSLRKKNKSIAQSSQEMQLNAVSRKARKKYYQNAVSRKAAEAQRNAINAVSQRRKVAKYF